MTAIVITDLTTKALDGTGVFDNLMSTVQLRIDDQYDKNRLNQADYAKLFLGSMDLALSQGVGFLLQKQAADKQADLLAEQIIKTGNENLLVIAQTAKVTSEKALVDQTLANAIIEGNNLTKLGLKIDAETLLIAAQEAKTISEELLVDAQKLKIDSDVIINGKQGLKIDAETSMTVQQEANAVIQGTILTAQALKVTAEKELLAQKKLTEEAQIVDRVTGAVADVTGVIGKQMALYTAQKDGFARDAEQKLAKIVADAWSVRSSVDPDTMTSPIGISDADVTSVFAVAKTGIGV